MTLVISRCPDLFVERFCSAVAPRNLDTDLLFRWHRFQIVTRGKSGVFRESAVFTAAVSLANILLANENIKNW